ncbi:MAG: Jag N-terminal domain-containing protein [Deltaproteobacteria bacterium]
MSNTIEFEGTSVEEAVEKACAALKVEASALDYTVIDEGSGGVFGLGARPVQIKVRAPDGAAAPEAEAASDDDAEESAVEAPAEKKKSPGIVGPTPEKAAQAEEVARGLLEKMGLAAAVSVRDEHEQIVIVIEEAEGSTDVVEVLGKSRPPAIPSLQFLLNKIVNRFPDDRKHILVEVPAVPRRERRAAAPKEASAPAKTAELDPDLDPTLVELGRRLAERAKSLNKVLTVHPMLAADRRAIHQTVTSIPGVRTVSEGEGLYRKMHVVPDELAGGRKKRRRRRRRRKDGEGREGAEGHEDGAESAEVQADAVEPTESAELQETGI